MATQMTGTDLADSPHYSTQTLDALVEKYGWTRSPDGLNVAKSFAGIEPSGEAGEDGRRTIFAGYRFDEKRTQYISAVLDDKALLNIDGRGRDPNEVARELNKRIEAVVAHQRSVTGYQAPEPATVTSSTLIEAVRLGDTEQVEDLLRSKTALGLLDVRDQDGFTPLHHAAIRSDRIAELLIAAGADISAKTPGGLGLQDLRILGGMTPEALLSPKAAEILKLQKAAQAQQGDSEEVASELWPAAGVAANHSRQEDEEALLTTPSDFEEEDTLTIKRGASRSLNDEDEGLIKAGQEETKTQTRSPLKTLLGGLYVGNDAGEYTRVGQKKVALIDAGAQITLKNREIETFQAGIELAQSKGWTSIEVGGSNRYRQAAWLEGRVRGLEVDGYEPTKRDLEALDKRLAEQGLKKSIAEGRPDVVSKSLDDAKSLAMVFKKDLVAPNLTNGTYSGLVLGESSHHVLVGVDGRANTATVIEKSKLDGIKYRQGEVLSVQFKNGALVPSRLSGQSIKATR